MEMVRHLVKLTDSVEITIEASGESLYLAHCRAAVEIDNIVAKLHAERFLIFKHAYAARADEAARKLEASKPKAKKRAPLKLKQTA